MNSFTVLKILCGDSVFMKSCLTLATPWTVPCQVILSVGFSRQEYWSGLPFPSPGNLPNPGIKPRSPALQKSSMFYLFIPPYFLVPGSPLIFYHLHSFPCFRMSKSMQPFKTWFFYLVMHFFSSISFHGLIAHFHLMLSNGLLFGYTTV